MTKTILVYLENGREYVLSADRHGGWGIVHPESPEVSVNWSDRDVQLASEAVAEAVGIERVTLDLVDMTWSEARDEREG